MHRIPRLCLLLLSALATACSTTSASFVESHPGYSVTKGRLLEVDGLTCRKVTALADGAAFTIDAANCTVVLRFDDDRKQTLNLQPPAMLVCGAAVDYVLQPADHSPAGRIEPTKNQQ